MGLFSGQSWKHEDADKRYDAVSNLDDQEKLLEVARTDSEDHIRICALRKLTDMDVITEFAHNDPSDNIRAEAVGMLTDSDELKRIIENDQSSYVQEKALERITDAGVIEAIAMDPSQVHLRAKAMSKVTNRQVLINAALNDSEYAVRRSAAFHCKDPETMARVATSDPSKDLRDAIERELVYGTLKKCKDQEILKNLAGGDYNLEIRCTALEEIKDMGFLKDLADTEDHWKIKMKAYRLIGDEESSHYWQQDRDAEEVLNSRTEPSFRKSYMVRINRPELLADIACTSRDREITDMANKALKLDAESLTQIVRKSRQPYSRSFAAARIENPELLKEIIEKDDNNEVKKAAEKRLLDISENDAEIIETLLKSSNTQTRSQAVAKNNNMTSLEKVALEDPSYKVRAEAIAKISNQEVLEQIALNDDQQYSRFSAVAKLTSKDVLREVAKNDSDDQIRLKALIVLRDHDAVAEILKTENNWEIRRNIYREMENADMANYEIILHDNRFGKSERDSAIEAIRDQAILAKIMENDDVSDIIKKELMPKITDQKYLAKMIVKTMESPDDDLLRAVLQNLEDPESLIQCLPVLTRHLANSDGVLRKVAAEKLIIIARSSPQVLKDQWDGLTRTITTPVKRTHDDSHWDNPDCNVNQHTDNHGTEGIGLSFPPYPN